MADFRPPLSGNMPGVGRGGSGGSGARTVWGRRRAGAGGFF